MTQQPEHEAREFKAAKIREIFDAAAQDLWERGGHYDDIFDEGWSAMNHVATHFELGPFADYELEIADAMQKQGFDEEAEEAFTEGARHRWEQLQPDFFPQ